MTLPESTPLPLPPLSARQENRLLDFLEEVDPAGEGEGVPRSGTILGGCRIEGRLGRGGMGEVFAAAADANGRRVAVKVLHPWLFAAPKILERFQREAQLAARIDHPNVVAVLRAGCEEGMHFLVLEFVDGESLAARLARVGRLSMSEALDVAEQAAGGLGAAHALGFIHRDVKPANLLIARDGTVKVADFGLARDVLAPGGFTTRGRRLGTLPFMAPEQAEGRPVDLRADLYALGATLYTMLAGRMPFQGANAADTLRQVLTEPPPPLAKQAPGLPPALDALVAQLLDKDPARRPPDADALICHLQAVRRAPVRRGWRDVLFGGR